MTNQVPPAISFVDNPHAPEVFAFQLAGLAFFAGNIHLTFEAPRVNHVSSPGPVNRVVVGRLVIPMAGAEGMRDMLSEYIKQLKSGAASEPTIPPRTIN